MKLSSLRSNKPEIFTDIEFRDGLNVIFAKVSEPKNRDKDSHNLGKTFLITVIDFCLLAQIDKNHTFREREDLFADFVFFLEIENHEGKFLTIRRPIAPDLPISLHLSDERMKDPATTPVAAWNTPKISLEKAKTMVSSFLNLEVLSPENYRKGLGYILRRQVDYNDVFRISKFVGKDLYWKPFVAKLLGFNSEEVRKKYELADQVQIQQKELERVEAEAGTRSEEFDELQGLVEIRTASLNRMKEEIEKFSFRELEAEISETLVQDIETSIAASNQRRYTIDYELQEIEKGLNTDLNFDLERIKKVFKEVEIEFSDALTKSYDELIEFNKKLSSGRFERLSSLKAKLENERASIQIKIESLDSQRTLALQNLQEQKTLEKYKFLNSRVIERESEVASLRERLKQLDKASTIKQDISKTQKALEVSTTAILDSVKGDNVTYSRIRATFNECAEQVLNAPALIAVKTNQAENLEFSARIVEKDENRRETREASGNTYRKILCACFDLSLLRVYSSRRYYRFVYHDGIFEGLDNRKKANLVELIHESCEKFNLQYVLTVIDSDLPKDERDKKQFFSTEEIILTLHDKGLEGRLFRMPTF